MYVVCVCARAYVCDTFDIYRHVYFTSVPKFQLHLRCENRLGQMETKSRVSFCSNRNSH